MDDPNEVKVYYLTDEELARYRALPMPPGAREAARRQHRKRKGADDMPKVLSEETHERVDEMIRRGNGPTAIVRATGVSTGTVYYRAAKLGTPRFDYGAQQWVAVKDEGAKEGEDVKDLQRRIEQLIAEGTSPERIRRQEVVLKGTLDAACERLGVVWSGERWESVKRPEEPGEYPAEPQSIVGKDEILRTEPTVGADQGFCEMATAAPVPDSEKVRLSPGALLGIAIREVIDAQVSPEKIARTEHCRAGTVIKIAAERGLVWDSDAEAWVQDDARAETPQVADSELLADKHDALEAIRACARVRDGMDHIIGVDLRSDVSTLLNRVESQAEAVLLR